LFTDAKFYCEMRFTGVRFFKDAFFENAVFLRDVYFMKTEFLETASFKNAEFHGEIAKFKMAVFSKIAIFEKTAFKHYANFTDSKFYGRTSFQQAKFENHAPRFYGATLNKQIAWDKITWPKFSTIFRVLLDDTHNKDAIRENQNSYENLAYLMEELGKYHDQHLFFREEMRCRRRLDERFLIRWAFWLYEKLSDYGYGIERAILAWALHIFIGFLVITFIAMCGGIRYQESVSCAISVSFANANPYAFFGFDSVQLTGCYDMFNKHAPILFAIIKVIQTILGIALLFLVGLTLRVRFRLK
nr:pentapeptide repeat-containing protein [Pseudomonadota bacterium]